MGSPSRKKRKALLGKKVGMTQLFEEDGRWVPVTVLQAGPCTVLQVKTLDTDGYEAVQLGFDDRRNAKQPQRLHCERIGVTPKRYVREVPFVDPSDISEASRVAAGRVTSSDGESAGAGGGESAGAAVEAGGILGVQVFAGVTKVDVRGVTKGRGFTGTIKRHRFASGDKSHGSKNVREPGSTGMHTDPGRVHKGKKMPGQYGNENVKMRNLKVVRLDEERNLLLVKGSVPGPNGGYLYIEESLSS